MSRLRAHGARLQEQTTPAIAKVSRIRRSTQHRWEYQHTLHDFDDTMMTPRLHQFRAAIVTLAFVVAPAAALASATAEDGPVRVQLVSDIRSLDTDGTVGNVAVLLEIEPQWHVYWRHPGDSGLATEVHWKVPDGVRVGAPQWPTPSSFDEPGGHRTFGYSGAVLLASPVQLQTPLTSATVTAEVAWLACKERCILGEAAVDLVVPVDPTEAGAASSLFEEWQQEIPRAANEADAPYTVTSRAVTTEDQSKLVLQTFLKWRLAPTSGTVEWFPIPPKGVQIRSDRVRTRGDLTRIDTELRVRADGTVTTTLPSVLVYAADDSKGRQSIELHIPLSQGMEPKPTQ